MSPLGVNWVIEIGAGGVGTAEEREDDRSAVRRRCRHFSAGTLVVSVSEAGEGGAYSYLQTFLCLHPPVTCDREICARFNSLLLAVLLPRDGAVTI